MSQPVIRFENVGKLYRLGTVGTGTLAHDLRRWWIISVMRKEDPYLQIGETNDRSTKGSSEYVYALKDINLEVQQGDVLGIIGKNGAGKSTLLKLLSRVTAPTTGKIYTKGRIASLLEVGTGFHGELTGRENIYMNGSILGMKKWEIDKKLDEIIDFSGCERYIDTPVKRYSSGMMVRLGFAVAAHLDPEILVVDEVLAVGDAEFQKKAIGKMQDVSKGEGRTVLFVSHNMTAVKSLCKSGIILQNGILIKSGDIDSIVSQYLRGSETIDNHKKWEKPEIKKDGFELLEIGVRKTNGNYNDVIRMDMEYEVIIKYGLSEKMNIHFSMVFKDERGEWMFSSAGCKYIKEEHDRGTYIQICNIPANFFNWGKYAIDLFVIVDGTKALLRENDIVSYSISNKEVAIGGWYGKEPGNITPNFHYTETKL